MLSTQLVGQSIWEDRQPDFEVDQRIFAKESRVVQADTDMLKAQLWAAPHERTTAAEQSETIIELPMPDGSVDQFSIVAYDISEAPALERYPDIRTWYGQDRRNPGRTVFLDWTARGFHAIIRGGGEPIVYIDPLGRETIEYYQVYKAADQIADFDFVCETVAENIAEDESPGEQRAAYGCDLLQYRTAISCTAEYSNWHGAFNSSQSNIVQSAVVTSVNRVNSVFTQDLSLRLLLVGDNDELYFYNETQEPFTSNSVFTLADENDPVIVDRIGSAAYDFGHVYTQGGTSGVALGLRQPCRTDRAASATSHAVPENDPFNIDYVSHEMGHQLGGNHTQNNNCNYSSAAGMEPGSASTIMGYAGICNPNVQNNSDAYFHGRNIEEINNYVENPSADGRGCATVINTSLSNPTLDNLVDERVPFGTPLVLRGNASGTNTITYNWEQIDQEQAVMPPQGTSVFGPLFRSNFALDSPDRFLPNLPDVIDGVDPIWEETPQVGRLIDFRLTVRHSNATYGCTEEDDLRLTVDGNLGPFIVTDPANGNQWSDGQTAQIQWDVAGTDANGIDCQNVDIYLLTDGGANFDVIASAQANDGFAEIDLAPGQITNDARIMVRAADNVFYNVSPIDFSIVSSSGSPAISLSSLNGTSQSSCFAVPEESVSFELITTSSGGASDALTPQLTGLPVGAVATFMPANPRPGGLVTLTISNMDQAAPATYSLNLSLTSAEAADNIALTLIKTSGAANSGPSLVSPSDGEIGVDIHPRLTVQNTGSVTYDFQLSTLPDFSNLILNLVDQPANSVQVPAYLDDNTTYYWRSRTNSTESGACGSTSLWTVGSFTTGDCYVYNSTAPPVDISDGPGPIIVEMPLDITDAGTITDLDFYQLDISHTWVSDLEVYLISPASSSVQVLDRPCGSQNDISISFSDEATSTNYPCPPTDGQFYLSEVDPLSDFDNEAISGEWRLRVIDLAEQDGGSINAFSIKACLSDFGSLPVSWLAFTAQSQVDHIQLDWRTEEEVDNAGFWVERTENLLRGEWQELGFVPASGQDRGIYTFDDETAQKGIDYFYRLRQQDFDGRVDYSPIRSARLDGEAAALELFPNPVSDILYFRRLNASLTSERYQLLDAVGRLVQQGQIQAEQGEIPLNDLATGVYYFRLSGQGEVWRVVKK
ncbi:MAG: reprolysin-like metallopeptidase [Bacteroidota bacterium]